MTDFTPHEQNSELWGKFNRFFNETILNLHRDLEKTTLTDLETAALRGRIKQLRQLAKLTAAEDSATPTE